MKSGHSKGAITAPDGKSVCLTCHDPNLDAHMAKGGGKDNSDGILMKE